MNKTECGPNRVVVKHRSLISNVSGSRTRWI